MTKEELQRENAARLAGALYRRANPNGIKQLAAVLNYLPEQLETDIFALWATISTGEAMNTTLKSNALQSAERCIEHAEADLDRIPDDVASLANGERVALEDLSAALESKGRAIQSYYILSDPLAGEPSAEDLEKLEAVYAAWIRCTKKARDAAALICSAQEQHER